MKRIENMTLSEIFDRLKSINGVNRTADMLYVVERYFADGSVSADDMIVALMVIFAASKVGILDQAMKVYQSNFNIRKAMKGGKL